MVIPWDGTGINCYGMVMGQVPWTTLKIPENIGKISENLAKIPENPNKISKYLGKIPENLGKNGAQGLEKNK